MKSGSYRFERRCQPVSIDLIRLCLGWRRRLADLNVRTARIWASKGIVLAMVCEEIRSAMATFATCEETDGARIATHCLYPSYETAHVYVVRVGNHYRVHDGGEAFRSAWSHGRDEKAINRAITAEASRFHLSVLDNRMTFAGRGIRMDCSCSVIGVQCVHPRRKCCCCTFCGGR